MAQNYRNQNESGRWQDSPRAGQRSGGRERYETGNERRYSPDWDDRFHESGSHDDSSTSFEGDRSYSAGGYPEEFGYRRESHAERDRGSNQRYGGSQSGRDERPGGSYYDRPYERSGSERSGRNFEYGARDFGPGGQGHSQTSRNEANRYDFDRGGDFNRSRGSLYGGSQESTGANYYGSSGNNYYGSQATQPSRDYGRESVGDYGSERHAQQPSHRGRGPKGYERSDERMRELICERLTDDPYIDASEVAVEVNGKVVKLTGSVEDRRMKYLIEDVIEQCGGVRDIDNQLRVLSSQAQTAGSQAYSQTTQGQTTPGSSLTSQYGTSSGDNNLAGRGTDKSLSPSTKRN